MPVAKVYECGNGPCLFLSLLIQTFTIMIQDKGRNQTAKLPSATACCCHVAQDL